MTLSWKPFKLYPLSLFSGCILLNTNCIHGDCCQEQWYFLNYNNYRSSRHDCPVASLLQTIDNQVGYWDHVISCEHFPSIHSTCWSDLCMILSWKQLVIMVFNMLVFHIIMPLESCNYEELLIVGSCDQQASCDAWFLRKPEEFLPLPNPFIKKTHCGDGKLHCSLV